jgi:hypothetical protein
LLGEKVQLKARIKELEQDLGNDDRYQELVNLRAEEMRLGKTLKELDSDELKRQTSLQLE